MQTSACVIIIGNEILSGRTKDENLSWLAKALNEIGIRVTEARVIPDIEQTIIETVNECRKSHAYVFTTGGIGPTHDDITSAAVAKAFGLPLEQHAQALRLMESHYDKPKLNAARLKMTHMPKGARLLSNPVSIAPGFAVENVYVMAGIPNIMQVMFESIKSELKGGAPMRSATLSAYVTEGTIATALSAIQDRYPEVEIGSYPFVRQNKLGTSLVSRSTDTAKLQAATGEIRAMLQTHTDSIEEEN